jgi:hypothetical protein
MKGWRECGAAVAIVALLAAPVGAAVICKKKSGAVVVRDTACKKKETSLSLADFGAVGPTGPTGQSALTPLPSGATENGVWGAGYTAANGGDAYRATAEFPIPLAADFDVTHVVYVSGTSATHCPGVGQADPGYVCVYQGYVDNANTPTTNNIFDPVDPIGTSGQVSLYGFAIYLTAGTSGLSSIHGNFAVTAP